MTSSRKKGPKKPTQIPIEDVVDIQSTAQEKPSETDSPAQPAPQDKAEEKPWSDLSQEALEQALEKMEQEKQEVSDRLLRTMAEFDNYKKRVSREKADLLKYGTEKLALELLGVVDSFERALEQAKDAEAVGPVVDGIEMILKQLLSALEKYHICSFDSTGKPFDPEKHEAMAQQEHDEHEDNTIISEYQKGYTLKDRLLRPARVIVSKRPTPAEEGEEEEE